LTTQGQQTATQTASWSDFLLNTVNELSERNKSSSAGLIKMIRKLQQQGHFSGKNVCYLSILSAQSVSRVRSSTSLCAGECTFGDRHLRLNCAEHLAADPETAKQNWNLYLSK